MRSVFAVFTPEQCHVAECIIKISPGNNSGEQIGKSDGKIARLISPTSPKYPSLCVPGNN